jgi:hypothetical protein
MLCVNYTLKRIIIQNIKCLYPIAYNLSSITTKICNKSTLIYVTQFVEFYPHYVTISQLMMNFSNLSSKLTKSTSFVKPI